LHLPEKNLEKNFPESKGRGKRKLPTCALAKAGADLETEGREGANTKTFTNSYLGTWGVYQRGAFKSDVFPKMEGVGFGKGSAKTREKIDAHVGHHYFGKRRKKKKKEIHRVNERKKIRKS